MTVKSCMMIEAVIEDENVKAAIFSQLDEIITDPDAVLDSRAFQRAVKDLDPSSPTFQADDAAIPIGMRAMANVVLDYLRGTR